MLRRLLATLMAGSIACALTAAGPSWSASAATRALRPSDAGHARLATADPRHVPATADPRHVLATGDPRHVPATADPRHVLATGDPRHVHRPSVPRTCRRVSAARSTTDGTF